MKQKIDSVELQKLLELRSVQLASFRNQPNQLEVVWQDNGNVVLNHACSRNIESALEAVSAIKSRVIWITEMDYSSINFHGVLTGVLDKLDFILHVGESNPLENLGKATQSFLSLEQAFDFAVKNWNDQVYIIYAPANEGGIRVKDRGDSFREIVKNRLG